MQMNAMRMSLFSALIKRFAILVLINTFAIGAHAQQADWELLNKEAAALTKKGEHKAAIQPLVKALEAAESVLGTNHKTVALLNYNLALAYDVQGLRTESLPFYERFLAISESIYGLDHAQVKLGLNTVGGIYKSQRNYGQAEALYLGYLEKMDHALGKNHPNVADILYSLGVVYELQAKYSEAEPVYTRLMLLRKETQVADSLDLASSMENLANVYAYQEKYALAAQFYGQALAIREKAFKPNSKVRLSSLIGSSLIADRPELAKGLHEAFMGAQAGRLTNTLEKLAEVYVAQELFEQAEPLYLRVLDIKAETGDSEKLGAAATLDKLASLYRKLGRASDANSYTQRAIKVRAKHQRQQ